MAPKKTPKKTPKESAAAGRAKPQGHPDEHYESASDDAHDDNTARLPSLTTSTQGFDAERFVTTFMTLFAQSQAEVNRNLIETLRATILADTRLSATATPTSCASEPATATALSGNFSRCTARFDGRARDPEVLEAFLDAVETYKECTAVSDEHAVKGLSMLLEGEAAVWWRGIKRSVVTWHDAAERLRAMYGAPRPGYELLREMFATEHQQERAEAFICRLRALIVRLPYAVPEAMQVDMIYGQLHRRIRKRLLRDDIDSVDCLLDKARVAEDAICQGHSWNFVDENEILGRGSRQRKEVDYTDSLTEKEWLKAIDDEFDDDEEEEDDDEVLDKKRKKGRKRRRDDSDYEEAPSSSKKKNKSETSQLKKMLKTVMKKVIDYTDEGGRVLSEPFMKLPSRRERPDYYDIIKKPLDIKKILNRIEDGKYNDFDDLERDFFALCGNAQAYNEDVSLIYADSVRLQQEFVEIRRRHDAGQLSEDSDDTEKAPTSGAAAEEEEEESDDESSRSVKMKIKLKGKSKGTPVRKRKQRKYVSDDDVDFDVD